MKLKDEAVSYNTRTLNNHKDIYLALLEEHIVYCKRIGDPITTMLKLSDEGVVLYSNCEGEKWTIGADTFDDVYKQYVYYYIKECMNNHNTDSLQENSMKENNEVLPHKEYARTKFNRFCRNPVPLTRDNYYDLVDGWVDGFVPETLTEEAMQSAIILLLVEAGRMRNWT